MLKTKILIIIQLLIANNCLLFTENRLPMKEARLLYKCEDGTGEGACWHAPSNSLLWVDIDNGILHAYSLSDSTVSDHIFPTNVTTIIPLKDNPDEVLLAVKDKLVFYNLVEKTSRVCKELPVGKDLRTNDGKASPEGRAWIGVMHTKTHRENGTLYCIDNDLSVREVLSAQSIPNGIVWNKKGDTMYYADSGKGCIYAFDYDKENGTLSAQRVAVSVPPEYGVPDGMTIDENDNLWVAHWGGFGVYIWNPETGALINKIEVPAPNVASCTFGGKDNKTLFITTALSGLSVEDKIRYPLSGSLFIAETTATAGENHYPFVYKMDVE